MKLSFLTISMRTFSTVALVLFLLVVAADLLLGRLYGQRLGDAWLETKTSKAELLLRQEEAPDFILLGDSRTQNHFNTAAMSESGVTFFNHGVVGAKFEDIIYTVLLAKDVAKRGAVLNFYLLDLEYPVVCSKRPMAVEIELLQRAVGENCSYSAIDGLFQKSLIRNQKFFRKPMDYFLDPSKYHQLLATYQTDLAAYGRTINYVRGDRHRLVVTFANGDGEVISQPVAASTDHLPPYNHVIKSINPDKVAILVALAEAFQEVDKQLIINFEPLRFNSGCEVPDLPELDGLADIVITCDKPYLYENWADIAHMNAKGIARYNADFLAKMMPLLK
ncbi:hypothetical protein N9K16_06795 [Alphaproteobacteria bacterium]|nr:hypothetical protein [Alphaproteobacteria bacterium]